VEVELTDTCDGGRLGRRREFLGRERWLREADGCYSGRRLVAMEMGAVAKVVGGGGR
jgi:hypothetical protein